MPFPERLLTDGEEVIVELRPHWSFLGWPLLLSLAAGAVVIGAVVGFPHAPIAVSYALLGALVLAVLWLMGRYVRYWTTTVILTNVRIIRRSGVIVRRGLEIRLERVNQLSFRQTVLGLMMRYGDVVVEVGGEAGAEVFHVSRPQVFQSLITEQLAALHRRNRQGTRLGANAIGEGTAHTPPTGTPPVRRSNGGDQSPADRLLQLDELRRRGILSPDEFETKRAELVKEL